MVCGSPLEYLNAAASFVCIYCGREDTGYVRCPVCNECHSKGAFEFIKDIALTTELLV